MIFSRSNYSQLWLTFTPVCSAFQQQKSAHCRCSSSIERHWLQADASLQHPVQDPLLWCEHWERYSPPPSLDLRQHRSWGYKHPVGVQRAEPPYPGTTVWGDQLSKRYNHADSGSAEQVLKLALRLRFPSVLFLTQCDVDMFFLFFVFF